ncbi:bifunctional metallophosphatase/5'-nucleotidase [Camelliibacillus cellulosilyticus]|uniref:Bifunctional metallophosphatase/5'-nucleotidase n=1 Tax=Camelliibacillus cellulosilyticus TaxID=2174486 RepID=A0ABV9GQB4_9BACL
MKLKILHTNDVHSHYDRFAQAATLIRQLKDDHSLVLEGGDFADFQSIELQGTKGEAAIDLLQSIGYDALTIGNNEMFNGIDTLEHMASKSPIPFISNNLFRKNGDAVRGVVSSVILEKGGLSILITGASPNLGVFNDGLGVRVNDYKEALMQELEKHHGEYDLCVLLNHIGTVCDDELANELSGIDVIISAHDHQLYPEARVANGTIMHSAGCYGEFVGVIELDITDGHVTLNHSATLPTKDIEADDRILAILKKSKEKAIEVLSRPLYAIHQPLWHDVIEENPIANLIADGLKDMLSADLGLINSGIVNAGLFRTVTEKKLIEICPSPLNPTKFDIRGKYIREALEQSLDVQICLADGKGPGFRGKYVGRLHVSGATIYHDGKKVTDILIGEAPLEDEKWYSVASSDYLERGSGYPILANKQNASYRTEDIRDVIRLYAEQPSFIERAHINRWILNAVS